jgi:hypothetical protein
MKKQYMEPNMQVVGIRPSGMLCNSKLGVDPTKSGSQSAAEGRGFDGDWDD